MMDCLTHRSDVNIFLQEPITDFLVNFGVFEWLYLVQYWSDMIDTKLQNVANFKVFFLTMWVSCRFIR